MLNSVARKAGAGMTAVLALALADTTAQAEDVGATASEVMQGEVGASAELRDKDGTALGTVTFRETPSGMVWVVAHATDLPEGRHGFHIHETGACDADGGFKSAGGHYAGGSQHGILTAGGPHPGDLPNVIVHSDGKLDVEFFVEDLELEDGWFTEAGLFDDDGSAIVVHEGADDYESQPSGDAGARIACGVLKQTGAE